jgi:hypothetical protein
VGRPGRFRPGDRIIAINGVGLDCAGHDDVVREMLAVGDLLDLVVLRDTTSDADNDDGDGDVVDHYDGAPHSAVLHDDAEVSAANSSQHHHSIFTPKPQESATSRSQAGAGEVVGKLRSAGQAAAAARESAAREAAATAAAAAIAAPTATATATAAATAAELPSVTLPSHCAGSPKKLEWFFGRDPSNMLMKRHLSVPLLGELVPLRPAGGGTSTARLAALNSQRSASADSGARANRVASEQSHVTAGGATGATHTRHAASETAPASAGAVNETESEPPVVRRLTEDDVCELVNCFDTHASLVLNRRAARQSTASVSSSSSSSTSAMSSYDRPVSSSSSSLQRRGDISRARHRDFRSDHRFSYQVTLTNKKHWGRFEHLGDF